MVLCLPDKWVWDFWLARQGPDYHIYYLQAPRSLGNPELRHWNVSIGHAVSQDLRNWEILPDALKPSAASGQWDNYTTWTGSVIQHDGLWYLFYTGTNREERGCVQRVGLATSRDLIHWQKHPQNPLITPSTSWYEEFDASSWHEQAWRDPWVFRHPQSGVFHAFITARSRQGPTDGRGVIASARSDDLVDWEVGPPVTESGDYGHMEVPQWLEIGGRYYLLFCVTGEVFSGQRRKRARQPALTGTYHRIAAQPLGPFHSDTEKALFADAIRSTYAGKMVPGPEEDWLFLYAHLYTPEGEFLGEIGDPLQVRVDESGGLSVMEQSDG
jgi:beta-fructofuranosidase